MIRYSGGKAKLAKWIIDNGFPPNYQHLDYIEPFVGGGWILTAKDPPCTGEGCSHAPRREHVNDANPVLAHAWTMLTDREATTWLLKRFNWHLHSRAWHDRYAEEIRVGGWDDSEIDFGDLEERVLRFLYLQSTCFAGKGAKGGFGLQKSGRNHLMAFTARVRKYRDRLSRHVSTWSGDFEEVIRHNDSTRAFIYCDPPYVEREGYYSTGHGAPPFTEKDHERLAEVLRNCEARWALSYYPCRLVDRLYPPKLYRRVERDVALHMRGVTSVSQLSAGDSKPRATELLIIKDLPGK